MDLIREIKRSLCDCSEKLKFIKVTTSNRNNDDYHLYIDEISDGAIRNLTEKVNFVEVFSKECQGKYRLKLNRPLIFKTIISRIHEESTKYGQVYNEEKNRRVLVNLPNFYEMDKGSLDDLRSLYMASLLIKLLLANSYNATLVPEKSPDDLEVCIDQMFGGTLKREPRITGEGGPTTDDSNRRSGTLLSDLFGEVKDALQSNEDSCEASEEMDSETGEKVEKLKINLKKFIESENLVRKFSANVNVLMLSPSDKSMRQLCDLKNAIEKCKDTLPASCIHVVHNKNYLQQQKMEVLWRMMDGRVHQSVGQHHLIYSRVSADDSNNRESNPEQLLKTRKLEIASAFKSKYGGKKAAFFTDEMMEEMAKASLRFEFLSIKPTLETKISVNGSCFEDRSGVFIFYNYARISTMLDKFQRLVEEGHYPPLPSVEEMDFSCLRQEEEWRILFNYVLEYPSVVRDSVTRDDGTGSVTSVATQKVCQFLSSLSNSFSKYYSKTHVLTDPLPHLLTTMQARLHLVRSVRQVYDNALRLLSIRPLHRL